MAEQIPSPQSSRVGWPFWIPTILATIPFTLLFLNFAGHDVPFTWSKILLALLVGLLPALITGLVVQLCWDIVKAAREGKFKFKDCVFAVSILVFWAGFTWVDMHSGIRFPDYVGELVFGVVMVPVIGLYIRYRNK